jgi:uncharacterized protein YodC (DUF2158 family)
MPTPKSSGVSRCVWYKREITKHIAMLRK